MPQAANGKIEPDAKTLILFPCLHSSRMALSLSLSQCAQASWNGSKDSKKVGH
jgi:hypothetical protein